MRTTQSAVSDLENGRVDPRLSTLQRYAEATGHRLQMELHSEPLAAATLANEGAAAIGSAYTTSKVLSTLARLESQLGPQSSTELAGRFELPEATVVQTLSSLEGEGWLTSVSERSELPRFSLRDDRGLAIGVSISRNRVDAVLTNLRATELVAHRSLELSETRPNDVLDAAVNLIEELRTVADYQVANDIVGLGASMAGLVDESVGSIIYATDFQPVEPTWRHVPLGSALEGRTNLPTVVENDANTLALYEYERRAEDQTLVSVLISPSGEGIGSGAVVNGSLLHGLGGVAGEIGHARIDPTGPNCRCTESARGCLETLISPNAISRNLGVRNIEEAAALAAEGEARAIEAFASAGALLGRQMVSSSVIPAAPNRIVLYGREELTDEDYPSARAFLEGCRLPLEDLPFGIKVDFVPTELETWTLPMAAAVTAVNYFLQRPSRSIGWLRERFARASQRKMSVGQ